jgi:hypothetical protein
MFLPNSNLLSTTALTGCDVLLALEDQEPQGTLINILEAVFPAKQESPKPMFRESHYNIPGSKAQ